MESQAPAIAGQSFELTPANLTSFGLQEVDVAQVRTVAARIQSDNPLSVSEFGREVSDHASQYADGLLDQVRNRDLDDAGAKLSEVVSVARAVNLEGLINRRSRLPIVGPLIDKMRLKKANLMGKFDTTRGQIDSLIGEVQATQSNLATRNAGLEEMFGAVRQEHHLLGIHIAAGKVRLDELRFEADALRANVGNDPARVQQVSDMDAMVSNLDKRVGDLIALQHSAMQSLPMIRMIQANNQMLVDKFHTIREITVPAWKRGFMLALALNEQSNAVELTTAIDEATNYQLRKNAELLHRNSTGTARANQRLVIDPETLQKVQATLIQTVEDVIKIQRDGVQKRREAEKQIGTMRTNLQGQLTQAKAKEIAG